MNWPVKDRLRERATLAPLAPQPVTPGRVPGANGNLRASNGLKEFLWLLSDVRRGHMLDLGPAFQSTINFFIERGFRIYTEDLLRSWKDFAGQEEDKLRQTAPEDAARLMTPEALAERFMETCLQYPAESFHAVLAWDIFDYLEQEVMLRVSSRMYDLLRPGGAVLTIFHSRRAERFHRYRVVENSIELVAAPPPAAHIRTFNNREILNMFGQFHTSKSFVGRDQLREGLFVK